VVVVVKLWLLVSSEMVIVHVLGDTLTMSADM
jgi:hypothetical protein